MPRDHYSAALKDRAEKLGLDMWAGTMSHWGLDGIQGPFERRLPIVKFRTLLDVEAFLDWYEKVTGGRQANA